jgi:hypothetical protein
MTWQRQLSKSTLWLLIAAVSLLGAFIFFWWFVHGPDTLPGTPTDGDVR